MQTDRRIMAMRTRSEPYNVVDQLKWAGKGTTEFDTFSQQHRLAKFPFGHVATLDQRRRTHLADFA